MTIQFGIDQLLKNPSLLNGKQIGLVTNHAAQTVNQVPTRKALIDVGVNLVLLFSPEHGLMVDGKDGYAITNGIDQLTGLPIFSLYGENIKPEIKVLQQIDILLFDLPDIGSRFYTYIWTLSYVMEACSEANISLIVLDRPNPLSGNLDLAEGPMLDEKHFSSFIGRWNIPIRHSLTIGELANYWRITKNIHLDLEIIRVEGWQRNQFFDELHIPFVPTSPAIKSAETALIYVGTCLFEGTNISEGRGTHSPFKICGTPWINGKRLADTFNDLRLDGVFAKAIQFTPNEGEYENQICEGISLDISDYQQFKPVSIGLHLIAIIKKLYPENFKWATYPTNVNKTGERHFDLLMGQDTVRMMLESDIDEFISNIPSITKTDDWKEVVKNYLLYH
ncbi:MAG: DUF1343 domain-containing protein [Arcicella sp.]|jgi:uncharacterized protein YbbC (DUF1343 family)|nr:DUF1343 domain-containing protein [Arcicella sp.]